MSSLRALLPVLILFAGLGAGCGLRFKPGFSMNDPAFFSEPPRVVTDGQGYKLTWRYGSMGFFFLPSSKVVDGQLHFALQATSSSASLSGLMGEYRITELKKIAALESGGAFWLEPGGRKVPLPIVNDPAEKSLEPNRD
jgi:hypothetical protein